MASRRRKDEQSNAGWLYADVLLGLLVVFLAASAINKPSSSADEVGSTTTTTSTTTPDDCLNIERDPIEFNINWSPSDGPAALEKAIQNGFREEARKKKSSDRGSDNVGVLLVFGGANGTSGSQAKSDAEEIWNVLKTDDKYKNASKKFLYMDTLPRGSAQLSFFMERACP